MTLFLIIFIILFLSIAARGFGSVLIPIIFLSIFAGIRGNVGYDTCAYKYLFSEALTGDFPFIEPGFFALLWLFRHLTNEPQLFLMLIAVIQGMLVYFIAKQTPNKFLWLGIFTAVFYYSFFFSTLRNALASLLLVFSYSQYLNKRPINLFPAIAAPLIHYTSIVEFIIFPSIGLAIILVGAGVLLLPLEQLFDYITNDAIRIPLSKILNLTKGLYEVEAHSAWHALAAIVTTQFLIILTVKGWFNILVLSLATTGAAVADLYFGRIGRVQIFGLLALSLVYCHHWRSYCSMIKALILIVYFYYSYAFTIYPITFGTLTQEAFAQSAIDSEPGNYHIWLFNNKSLCKY